MPKWHKDKEGIDPVTGRPLGDYLLSAILEPSPTTHYVPPRVMSEPEPLRSKYAALSMLLARRRGLKTSMSLARIDDVVGGLPPSAYRHRSWWANTWTSQQGKAWLGIDWAVTAIDLDGRSVTFGRDPMPEPAPTMTGYQVHWLQLKMASKAVESWVPGKVTAHSGEAITVRLPNTKVSYWCRFFSGTAVPLKGSRVWVNTRYEIVAVPNDDRTAVFSVRTLSVTNEARAIPPKKLHPGRRPPGFGLTVQEFSDLSKKDQRKALALIGKEIAWMLDTSGKVDLEDAIWSVGEYRFGGNGDDWLNSWEVQDLLSGMTEPLVYSSSGELGAEYWEQMSLLELGPGLCFFVFEPNGVEGWGFEEHVDRNDLARIRELAREGYYFGATGWKDPNFDPPGLSVYPPLEYEDILDDGPVDSERA